MKLFKTVPAAIALTGSLFASLSALADNTVFTVMDDPSSAKKPFETVHRKPIRQAAAHATT